MKFTLLGISLLAFLDNSLAATRIDYGKYKIEEIKVSQLSPYKTFVFPIIEKLNELVPDFATYVEKVINQKTWYLISGRPKGCPAAYAYKKLAKTVACQDLFTIQIYDDWFKREAPITQAQHIIYQSIQNLNLELNSNKKLNPETDQTKFEALTVILFSLISKTVPMASEIQKEIFSKGLDWFVTADQKKMVDADYEMVRAELFKAFCQTPQDIEQDRGTFFKAIIDARHILIMKSFDFRAGVLFEAYQKKAGKLRELYDLRYIEQVCDFLTAS